MWCKSEDGKLEGILIQHTPPELENAKDFANPSFMLENQILMGQAMPEWGVFENKPKGYLLAIGDGMSKGSEAAVFRRVARSVSPPMMYEFIEGDSYVVISIEQGAERTVVRLRRK